MAEKGTRTVVYVGSAASVSVARGPVMVRGEEHTLPVELADRLLEQDDFETRAAARRDGLDTAPVDDQKESQP